MATMDDSNSVYKKTVFETVTDQDSCSEDKDLPLSWMKRVELPTIEGNDPMFWIARIEKFWGSESKPSEKLAWLLLVKKAIKHEII